MAGHKLKYYLDHLISDVCPACGREKRRKRSLCLFCYGRLPGDLKDALYARIGQGYEVAFDLALEELEGKRQVNE